MELDMFQKGKIGEVFTEAIVEFGREMTLRNQIKTPAWSMTTGTIGDKMPPLVTTLMSKGQWDGATLTGPVLWKYEELAGSYTGSTDNDATLATALMQELNNRLKVRTLFEAAVFQYFNNSTGTDFYNDPVTLFVNGASSGTEANTLRDATENKLTTADAVRDKLLIILHMFGRDSSDDDRPAKKPFPYYSTSNDVRDEVQRRVQELAAGIGDEHKNKGGHYKDNKGVTHRNGFYCGCG